MTNKAQAVSVWDVDPVSTMLQRIHFQHTTKNLRTLSVVSSERLEGKTTVSILLARGLQETYNFKVLMVDLNPEGDTLLNQHLKDYSSKDGLVLGHPFSFSLFRIKDLEIDWSKSMMDSLYLNKMITELSTKYDLVIVDTPSALLEANSFIKLKTDSSIIVSSDNSFKTKESNLLNDIESNRKNILGVIFNK